MRIIRFNDYISESKNLNEHDGILVIVDVQKEFAEFQPKNFVKNIFNYSKDFPIQNDGGVYQIWDANKATNYSYNFPNTIKIIKKNYGFNFDKNIKDITERLSKKYQNIKEGQKFKLKSKNTYLVRVHNNHNWFYVNEDLYNLYLKLKGKTAIIVGGADNECVEDVYISMKSFGINPIYNHDYIYSAETNNNQVASQK